MKYLCWMIYLLTFCFPTWASESDSLDPDVKNIIDVWLEAQLDYEKVPYLSASYTKDQVVMWHGAYGHIDQEQTIVATEKTMASICSTTKVFTATAVMKLVDQGKLRLDDKLSDILPTFSIQGKSIADITVRTLLTHTSGLPRDTEHAYWSGPSHDFPTKDDFYQSVARQTRQEGIDTNVQYSNIGYALLGLIIEEVAKTSYKQYLEDEIFTPLTMDNSVVEMPKSHYGTTHAIGYSAKKRDGNRTPASLYQTQAMQPAAGISSNAFDLAKYASWHFRASESKLTDVISAPTLNKMYQLGHHDLATNRGIGFMINKDKQGDTWAMHGGICPGYTSFMSMNVSRKEAYSFVFSVNKIRAIAYINNLKAIIARAETIEKVSDLDVDLTQYQGFYDLHPFNSEYYIGKWGSGLVLLYLPVDSIKYAMHQYRNTGVDTFQRIENGVLTNETIVFHRDENGKVVSVNNEGGLHLKKS